MVSVLDMHFARVSIATLAGAKYSLLLPVLTSCKFSYCFYFLKCQTDVIIPTSELCGLKEKITSSSQVLPVLDGPWV